MSETPSFIPLADNPNLERSSFERNDAAKGAFSNEARLALAKAVRAKLTQVMMDKHLMLITYQSDHVNIVADNPAGLPSGVMYYDSLERRL